MTTAAVAMAVYGAIRSMNAKGGGIGLQFAALNLKIDQILLNQIYTLQAIAEVQKSIEILERQVSGLFVQNRYLDLTIDILALESDTKRFLESLLLLPEGAKLNQTKAFEYNKLISELGHLISKTERTVTLTKLDRITTEQRGIAALLALLPALPILITLLDAFRQIENFHSDFGWERSAYLSASRSLKRTMIALKEQRMTEVLSVHVDEATNAYKLMSAVPFWGAISKHFPSEDEDEEKHRSVTRCLKTPEMSGVSHLNYPYMYQYSQELTYHYISTRIPGAKPSEIVFLNVRLDDLKAHEGFSWGKQGQNKPRETIAHCEDGLPTFQGREDWVEPNGIVLKQTFDRFAQSLPAFNQALIYQGQTIKMQELMDVLVRALEKFDSAVISDKNLQSPSSLP